MNSKLQNINEISHFWWYLYKIFLNRILILTKFNETFNIILTTYCIEVSLNDATHYFKISDVASKESPHVLFYKMKQFRHFQYVYNQTADCESRVQKLQNDIVSTNQMAKDILIKIRILGDFSDEDLNLISKSEGRVIMIYHNKKKMYYRYFFFFLF